MLNIHRPLRVALSCARIARRGCCICSIAAPDRGAAFEIVVLRHERARRSTRKCASSGAGFPTRVHPIREFYEARGASLYRDLDACGPPTTRDGAASSSRSSPICSCSTAIMYLVTTPLLDAFRVANPQPALQRPDAAARRRRSAVPGHPRAVRDALAAGCAETRATVHLVNESRTTARRSCGRGRSPSRRWSPSFARAIRGRRVQGATPSRIRSG